MGEPNMEPVNIVCFWWGDWPDPDWGPEYVRRMRRMLQRHTTIPYSFTLFTDRPKLFSGFDARKLEPASWKGCLPKIEAFNPANGFKGRVFVFDLDTVITSNIDDILQFDADFVVRAWYGGLLKGVWQPDGDSLSFQAGQFVERIWQPLQDGPEEAESFTGGRERWWYRSILGRKEIAMWQWHFPDRFISYRHHCRNGLPEKASVVSFHGRPRIHEVDKSWVKEHWT